MSYALIIFMWGAGPSAPAVHSVPFNNEERCQWAAEQVILMAKRTQRSVEVICAESAR
jgi:hypothetical protein